MDKHDFLNAGKSYFPLTGFQTYLLKLGLSSSSAAVYASRVRCALRLAKPGELPTREELAQALRDGGSAWTRAGFRGAWKRYCAYLKIQGFKGAALPEQAPTVTDEWLKPLHAALRRLLPVVPMTPIELRYLTYGRIDQSCKRVDGVIFYATPRPLAKKQPRPRVLHASETDATMAFLEIVEWGYPNLEEPPEEDSPFLPYGGDAPMPVKIIQQVCAGIIKPKLSAWAERQQAAAPAAPEPETTGSRQSPPLFDLSLLKPPS
jgi:hypothetical protein